MSKDNDMNPGFYEDLSNEQYHRAPGISNSGLSLIAEKPILYKAAYIDRSIQRTQSASMLLGSIVHSLTLEKDIFSQEFVIAPPINKRTKAGKQEWTDFLEENSNKQVVTPEQYETGVNIATAILSHEIAGTLFQDGIAEASIFDNYGDHLVKVRPDYLRPNHPDFGDCIVDLKTTQDASYDGFQRSLSKFRYYVQAAMYHLIVSRCDDIRFIAPSFIFVVVETTEPYLVATYKASNEMLEAGIEEYLRCLDIYSWCKEWDIWPGYNHDEMIEIDLPGWVKNQRRTISNGTF